MSASRKLPPRPKGGSALPRRGAASGSASASSRGGRRSGGGGGGGGLVWLILIVAIGAVAYFLAAPGAELIQALKEQLAGGDGAGPAEDPEIAAIRGLYEAGQYDQAFDRIQRVVAADPGNADAFYYKGLTHLARAGDTVDPEALGPEEQASLESFQRALSANPRHVLASVGIGDLYRRRLPARRRPSADSEEGDPFALASEAYQRAVTIDPAHAEAQHRYAVFLEQTGQLPEAEAAYRAAAEAAAVVPETAPDYYLAYGRFLAGPGDRLDEALAQFELAQMFRQEDTAIRQEMGIVYSRIGLAHMEKQEYMLAEEALTKAQGLFPDASHAAAQETEKALSELRSIRRR